MSSNNKFGTIQIGDILVSEDVVTEYFACDYAVCKGCCCIIGDSGAPLEESELEPLEENYPIYSKLMRPQGREQIDKEGFFSIDRDGDIVTPVVDRGMRLHHFRRGRQLFLLHRTVLLPRRVQVPQTPVLLALPDPRHQTHRRRPGPEPPSLGNMQGCLRERPPRRHPCLSVPPRPPHLRLRTGFL